MFYDDQFNQLTTSAPAVGFRTAMDWGSQGSSFAAATARGWSLGALSTGLQGVVGDLGIRTPSKGLFKQRLDFM